MARISTAIVATGIALCAPLASAEAAFPKPTYDHSARAAKTSKAKPAKPAKGKPHATARA